MTLGLPIIRDLSDGRRVMIEGDVLDIGRRLVEGDPTIGWPGCSTLALTVDPETGVFEVWDVDPETGAGWPVAAHSRCDGELIRRVIEADGRVSDIWARISAHNEQVQRDAEKSFDEWLREDFADRLHFALRKDLGHLEP